MKKNTWNDIWKKKSYFVESGPTTNVAYFYNYHLKSLNRNSKIIDCGCGNGRNYIFLKKKGFDVIGTDISETVIKKNKKNFSKYKNKFLVGDIRNLKFNDNYFDALVSDASLYYQSKKDIFETVDEFYRILKKNGIIRIYTKSNRDNFYFNHKREKSFEYKVKKKHWENGLLMTFLNFNDIKLLFKKFKRLQIGIDEFNYINSKKKHSYWIITAIK